MKAIGVMPEDWQDALGEAASPDVLESIDARVAEDRARGAVYPPAHDVFAAFRLTPFASVRAVILGQDPYHHPGQAHGLAFSVPDGCTPLPPSLRNIRAELPSDVGLPSPPSGSLVPWTRQGVLLLNTALTVREGIPGSHGGGLWNPVVDGVLAAIAAKPDPVVLLLVGRRAHDRARGIDSERHPHVLSARRKATLTAEIEEARKPRPSPGSVDPARALAWPEDLRSLWEVELPEATEHGATRREYELRRAEATASAFDRLEALGPVIVEAKVADDLLIGRSLVLALAPERAELTGEKAAVMQQLIDGRRSRLIRSDTTEARKKRHQRSPEGTLRCIGRGERSRDDDIDV